jgi:hypothetical protein
VRVAVLIAALLAVGPAAASAGPPRDGRLAFGTCDSVDGFEKGVLWKVRSDGSHLRRVRMLDRIEGLPCSSPMPLWSPDGRLLASRDLYGIHVETPRGRRVVTLKHPFASYEWTPGRRSMTVAEPRSDGAFRRVEVPLDGGRPRSLSPPLPELRSFTWTPDRRAIFYSVINGDDYEVRRYRIGASRSERVGAGVALEVSPDGRRLLVGHDGVLWSQRLGGGGRRALLRSDEVGLLGSAT